MVFALAGGLDLDFKTVLVPDLTLTFDFAGLLALAFAFAFALVAFFVVARRADVLGLLELVLLEAGRFDLPAALFAAGLLLLETRFLLVVFFFFSFVVPLIILTLPTNQKNPPHAA